MKPLIHLVAGARPDFMTIAPIVRALRLDGRLDFRLVRLRCGDGTPARQTARIMGAYEELCRAERPAATVVVGDGNPALACSLVAKKLQVPVAHVEAGPRSGDRAMPEEVNRLATDALSDWFFVTGKSGVDRLRREGKPMDRVFEVGFAAERIARILARELIPQPAPRVQRLEVLGCGVDNLSMAESVRVIEGFIASGLPHQHVVVNVDKLVKARSDPELRRIVNQCDLINADGMPVVWASRLLGTPLKERVAGIDLFEALMARAPRKSWRVFLLGAREEVVSRVKTLYEAKYPGLVVAGHRNGYWKDSEEAAVAEEVRAAAADILFVAISSPRKERFLGRWQAHMRVPFAMGVGGTFDVAVGKVSRAPAWMQRAGLEWSWRVLQEPRRMFKRYFIDDLAFFGMLGRELITRRTRHVVGIALSLALAAASCMELAEA